jgi:hypothetical protein
MNSQNISSNRMLIAQIDSLLKRNKEMAVEISSLKGLNRNLKKLLSKLLKEDLIQGHRKMKDKETQTNDDDFIPEKLFSDRLQNFEINAPLKSVRRKSIRKVMEEREGFPTTPIITQKKLFDIQDGNMVTPSAISYKTVESIDSIGRIPRSVKKPVSYQETPLNIKVRKGFQFFKFKGNDENKSK